MSEIISITPKLEERAKERAEIFLHLDRKAAMVLILSRAIAEMFELGGEPPESLAATLRHAASVLEDDEDT